MNILAINRLRVFAADTGAGNGGGGKSSGKPDTDRFAEASSSRNLSTKNSRQQFHLNDKLLESAKAGNLKNVRGFLDQGAQVNGIGPNGDTPLQWAAEQGHTKTVQLLVDRGANVNATNNNGDTPLMTIRNTRKSPSSF